MDDVGVVLATMGEQEACRRVSEGVGGWHGGGILWVGG